MRISTSISGNVSFAAPLSAKKKSCVGPVRCRLASMAYIIAEGQCQAMRCVANSDYLSPFCSWWFRHAVSQDVPYRV